jgi:hypothetical protein
MFVRLKVFGSGNPCLTQTNRGQLYTLVVKRKKKEKTQTTKETSREKIRWEIENKTIITIHSEISFDL